MVVLQASLGFGGSFFSSPMQSIPFAITNSIQVGRFPLKFPSSFSDYSFLSLRRVLSQALLDWLEIESLLFPSLSCGSEKVVFV